MRIAIATVQVPFVTGGAEILTKMLCNELKKRGHQSDIITIPFKWYPGQALLDCMVIGRMIDLTEVNGERIDRIIAMKFPAYYVKHDNKVLWLMHQHRQAYDLWGTKYGDLEHFPDGKQVRQTILKYDNKYLREAKTVYTIAKNTGNRLMKYNGIPSETLYHPPLHYEQLHCEDYGDYIFYASRIDQVKRQRLMVEAARYTKTDVRFVIAGSGSRSELAYIQRYIEKYHLQEKIILAGFISEEEKIAYYANCLAVYFGTYDEDYGYITLEGFFSHKPVVVHPDAGGPLEFVCDGEDGFIVDSDPKELAEVFDRLYLDRKLAKELGEAGYRLMNKMNMDWNYIIDKLLS